jgi:hypothetical protein
MKSVGRCLTKFDGIAEASVRKSVAFNAAFTAIELALIDLVLDLGPTISAAP